ncbi:hypothetical protein DNK47_02055, partial [Mycoplasma wenyonii]
MSRRLKLGLGGLGFLIINGSVLPTVGINWNVFKPLEGISQWGGQFWLKEETRKKEKDLKLVLPNSNFIDINLPKDNIQLSDIKLEQKSSDIKLDTSLDYPKQSALPIIKDISSEITKWEKIFGIGSQAFSRFDSLSLKPESTRKYHFRNLQSVKSQIQKWYRTKSQHQTRTHNNEVPQLSKEQRNSLKVIYNLYAKLNEFKSQLSSQMQQLGIGKIKRQETQSSSHSTLPTVSQSLDWIGWSNWTVRIHKNPNNYSREEFDTKSWGPWIQNPYANFYDSEDEFQQDI